MAQVMIIANALLALVYAFNSPTYKSLIREVIEKDRIGVFNSIAHAGSEIIRVVGPIIGVGLVGLIGVRGALIFNALTFLVSAIAEAFLTKVIDDSLSSKKKSGILSDIAEGFKYLFMEKEILFLIILSSMVNFFLAGYNLLLPYTDVIYSSLGRNFYSKALVMEAVGGIIGSFIFTKAINKFRDNVLALILFLLGTGASLALEPVAALINNYYICLIPFALFGMLLTAFNIQFMSYVQVAVNECFLGRVFSIIFTVAVLLMPVGSFFFSAFMNMGDVNSFCMVGGGIMILSAVSILIHSFLHNK